MQTFLDLAVALATQPWAAAPGAMHAFAAMADQNAFRPVAARSTSRHAGAIGRSRGADAGSRTAIIQIVGYIEQHAGLFTMLGLGCSTDQISRALRGSLADPAIDRIVLEVDSGGGSVFGVLELADEIFRSRAQKPIIGVANSFCASAAYWIASQCSELYVAPGGQVGSIGIVTEHRDESRAMQAAGVNITLITAGLFKAESNPFAPLSKEARAFMQGEVQSRYNDFTRAVARGRGVSVDTVRRGMGEGRMVGANDAVRERMVDGVASLTDVLNRKARPAPAYVSRGAYDRLPPALARAMREMDLLK